MTPAELMAKADQALASARLLLDNGDTDGACNRAYYAMFDAARAALMSAKPEIPAETVRTHGGLITTFSLQLVKTGQVALEHGKSLNRVQELRLIADYKGDPVAAEDAGWALAQANEFVRAMAPWISGRQPS